MRLAMLVAVSACGRFHFDPLDDAGDAGPTFRCAAKDINVGLHHTCVVDSVGAVWCWGNNAIGQSVPGAGPRAITTPMRVDLPTTAAQVATGMRHSCARLDDGSVWCWGDNSNGELGDGSTAAASTPVLVQLGSDRAIDLDVGATHTCIRRALDGAVMCFGSNDKLQLGVAGMPMSATPMVVAGTAGSKQLALGHRHNCAVDASDRAICWGNNSALQLGSAGGSREVPMPVAGLGAVSRVSTGGPFSCAIEVAGSLRCWGRNDQGQLGTTDMMEHLDAQPPIVSDAVDAALDMNGGCAVRSDGSMTCWGSLDPMPVELTNVTLLSSRFAHHCAVAGGALTCWGDNLDGQLGRGVRSMSATPIAIPIAGTPDRVAAGGGNACALISGALWCWGSNSSGESGVADPDYLPAATMVDTGLPSIEGIDTEAFFSCAWGGGMASCWGTNTDGQLGIGSTSARELPRLVTVAGGITKLATGWFHACAIVATGVVCWGRGNNGQLGDGNSTSSLTAVPVANLNPPITDLAVSGAAACAIVSGAVWCWGLNYFGLVGNNSTNNQPTPFPVGVPGTVVRVDMSAFHTCALNSAGAVYCWGDNVFGELGLGATVTQQLVPTLVPLPEAASKLTTGASGTCVELMSGTVMCWGVGQAGQNASGDPIDTTTPQVAPDLAGAALISRGSVGGCAIIAGTLQCWGTTGMLANSDQSELAPMRPQLDCP